MSGRDSGHDDPSYAAGGRGRQIKARVMSPVSPSDDRPQEVPFTNDTRRGRVAGCHLLSHAHTRAPHRSGGGEKNNIFREN